MSDPTIQESLIVADQFDGRIKMVDQLRKLQAVAKSIERAHTALGNRKPPTIKGAAKDGADRRAIKQQIDRDMHELHCLAVEIGIADADPVRYGERRIAAGFGRDHLEMRRFPVLATAYADATPGQQAIDRILDALKLGKVAAYWNDKPIEAKQIAMAMDDAHALRDVLAEQGSKG